MSSSLVLAHNIASIEDPLKPCSELTESSQKAESARSTGSSARRMRASK